MFKAKKTLFAVLLSLPGLSLTAGEAFAQSYPARPIKLIVHLAPGGGLDFVARLLAGKLTESLGQTIIVENRLGASGVIASEAVARATPDGYTLQIANNSSHGVNQAVSSQKLPFDTVKDFSCVAFVGSAPIVVVVPSSLPANSIKDLVALAKSKPGQLNYGSGGTGSQTHLYGELFKYNTGTDMVHIAYKGAAPGMNALLSNEIQIFFASTTSALPNMKAGKIKALGVSAQKRLDLIPDVPTMLEQNQSGFDPGPWYALVGPAGLPQAVVTRLNQEVVKAVRSADFKAKMASLGGDSAENNSAEECSRVIKNELDQWTKLVKATNLKVN
jgi:tripartite-type tricarboxylate transporter receptor subunit TctC